MIEFTIADHQYQAGKLSARRQFHVSRRLAPLMAPVIPAFVRAVKDGQSLRDPEVLEMLVGPIAEGLSKMADADAEYVIDECLGVVRRYVPEHKHWAAIWNPGAGLPMFDDLNDLALVLRIVMRVVQDSLGPFIQGFLSSPTPTSPT